MSNPKTPTTGAQFEQEVEEMYENDKTAVAKEPEDGPWEGETDDEECDESAD